MQLLQTSYLFTFPKTLNPHPPHFHLRRRPPPSLLLRNQPSSGNHLVAKSFTSDEFPVDETFIENFGPKDKETEDEARRRNWIERGWAPWEEILTPEADFARKSLNEGEEVPLRTPEAIEAFKMLNPKYRKKKMEEMGLTEQDYYLKQFEIKGEIPEPLVTHWRAPLVVRLIPPRDWPPRGWEVDRKELAFIREAHKLLARRVSLEELENEVRTETEDMSLEEIENEVRTETDDMSLEEIENEVRMETEDLCLDRYKMFLKQYKDWVNANKDRLEEESYKQDQDYYPGRRKRGKDYKEGMYELPFYYPGQVSY